MKKLSVENLIFLNFQHYTRCHKFSKACDLCHATFSTYMNLQKHIKVIHKKILAYECSFCGKRFGHKQPLKNHEVKHEIFLNLIKFL